MARAGRVRPKEADAARTPEELGSDITARIDRRLRENASVSPRLLERHARTLCTAQARALICAFPTHPDAAERVAAAAKMVSWAHCLSHNAWRGASAVI